MAFIDTHTHVFPSMRERLQDQLPHSVFKSFDEWLQRTSVPPSFASLKSHWIKWVESLEKKNLDIEGVASLQSRLHPQMYRVLEGLITSVLGPKLVLQGTTHNLLDSMQKHDVQMSVIIAAATHAPSEWVLDQALENKALVPVIDLPLLPPTSQGNAYEAELNRLVDRGAKGFQIHSNFDNLPGNHPAYQAYFEVAKRRDIFILLHTGQFHVPIYKSSQAPSLLEFEPYFQAFKDVRVCLSHMNRENPEEAWVYMKKYPQLYTDTSWQSAAMIRQAISAIGYDRLLLGSDFPFLHMDLQKDAIAVLSSAVSEKQLQAIGYDNAMSFLNINIDL
jgi:predicted TIM-barrel fold metal-dependent hydrolase